MLIRRQLVKALAAVPASLTMSRLALAQKHDSSTEYPARPVKIVVAFGAGSQTDALVRLLAPAMSKTLGGTIFVENKPGATGIIGTEYVARAAPDGYTLVMGGVSSHGTLPSLVPKLPYDAMKDFVPVGLATSPPAFIAVHPSVPATNLKEFIAWSRERPSGVSYSSSGVGSSGHLTAELLTIKTGAKLVQVPYKDVGQAISDLVGGHVQMMIYYAPLLPYIRDGRLRALAVLSEQRVGFAKDVPTAIEQGFPGVVSSGWTGLFGPAGLPTPIRDRLQEALGSALADPSIRQRLAEQGQEPLPLPSAEFGRFVQGEITKWAEVVKISGAKME